MHGQHDPMPASDRPPPVSDSPDAPPHGQRVPEALTEALRALGASGLAQRAALARRLLHESGASYNVYRAGVERQPWPLDVAPLLIASDQWAAIEAGLAQRAELLNLLLSDLYGPRETLRRGLLPPALVFGHGGFLRACQDIRLPYAHQLPLYAADLARDRDGRVWVLADRTQAPSGLGYALENRRVTARVLPSLYRQAQVHRHEPFLRALRANLAAAAPAAARHDPALALLTPGARNETYFEHALLAARLGLQLVEGADLVMRGGRLQLRALQGLRPVDVLWRRVDDAWCDPLELRPDSVLGVPGLVEAARRRQVSVINPLGSGVLENPALGAYLPALARHFLGEELRLPGVESFWCGDPKHLSHVLEHLPRLVIKRLQRRAGERAVFGADLDQAQIDTWRARIRARPAEFAAQAMIAPLPVPSFTGRALARRPLLLRAFLTAGNDGYRVLPGGFARVAPRADTLLISNQAGAMGKDVWVLASEPEADAVALAPMPPAEPGGLPRRAAENLFWLGRYLERALAGLGLLRLLLERLGDGVGAPPALAQALARLTGQLLQPVDEAGVSALPRLHAQLCDAARPGSVAVDLQALAQAAEAVREQLPAEAARLLADVGAPLAGVTADATADELRGAVQAVLMPLLALRGALGMGMERSDGWHFLALGACIERGQNLCGVLRGLLCGAHEPAAAAAFEFATGAPPHAAPAAPLPLLERLLLDARQPRGLLWQLQGVERHLSALPKPGGRRPGRAERLALEALTRLRLLDPDSLLTAGELDRVALDQFLTRGDHLLRALSDVLTAAYFQPPAAPHALLAMPPEPA
ncbi:circularly permuted type 2 ATP-grasp protein [Immundisolibacter sp.]|uniref:circularly permuted type 2 ATP-grasp protein n=1 Tax=Immundisolibacter sp. TaxID=1934948 RepID=UPI0026192297|nr:circularly permuted type 2 ATP-grasp protein [Immundisolibacter sp.]MDD3650788.1 circularly permuted type 2 ATP-grasp protein [Immundisolibacter sp.]